MRTVTRRTALGWETWIWVEGGLVRLAEWREEIERMLWIGEFYEFLKPSPWRFRGVSLRIPLKPRSRSAQGTG